MSTIRETPQTIEQDFKHLGNAAVIYNGVETWGALETRSEPSFDAPDVPIRREIVTVATGILTGLKQGRAITVAGEPREIVLAEPANDGAETEITLRSRDPRNRKHRGA